MIRLRSHSRKKTDLRFEIIPIIDVMFTLLIFFVIYCTMLAPISSKGIQLKLPTASSVVPEKKGVTVSVDASQKVYLDSVYMPSELVKLKVAQLMKENPETYVILSVDRTVEYDFVVHVLDSIRLGGCANVVLEAEQKNSNER